MVSEEGTYYTELMNLIKKAPQDLRLVLLSATPMFDNYKEIIFLLNTLLIQNKQPIIKQSEVIFNKKGIKFNSYFDGKYHHYQHYQTLSVGKNLNL